VTAPEKIDLRIAETRQLNLSVAQLLEDVGYPGNQATILRELAERH
jgi:hypothetical protein